MTKMETDNPALRNMYVCEHVCHSGILASESFLRDTSTINKNEGTWKLHLIAII
jgi:hypothetical protein